MLQLWADNDNCTPGEYAFVSALASCGNTSVGSESFESDWISPVRLCLSLIIFFIDQHYRHNVEILQMFINTKRSSLFPRAHWPTMISFSVALSKEWTLTARSLIQCFMSCACWLLSLTLLILPTPEGWPGWVGLGCWLVVLRTQSANQQYYMNTQLFPVQIWQYRVF